MSDERCHESLERKDPAVLYWSGGKDSAMAFHEVRTHERYSGYRVASLLTTLTEGFDRISGHGVRRSLLERQAACLGLDLHKTYIPQAATMEDYDAVIEEALLKYRREGTDVAVTGDICVEKRRMATFKKVGMHGCFPLMFSHRRQHVMKLIELGFKAYVVCVDSAVLDSSFVGRAIDQELVEQLPLRADPCGENGEFHTFVYDGPIFREPVKCKLGDIVFRS